MWLLTFLLVDAAYSRSGHLPWLTADPLELITWLLMGLKLTA